MTHFRPQRGFTLIELMFSITIFAVLLSLAVPSFRQLIENNRLVAQNNELVTALNAARSEALRRAADVTVCASEDGATCTDDTDWSGGWIIFVDTNADGTISDPEEVLRVWPATEGNLSLNTSSRGFVRYTNTGTSAFAETFSLFKPGCEGERARQISVAVTGRVSTAKAACEES